MASAYNKNFSRGSRTSPGELVILHRTGTGKTLLAPGPVFNPDLSYSEEQGMHQAAVRDAATFAVLAADDDIYLLKSRRSGATAYALAFMDWFGAPEVLEIDMDHWSGKPGQTIRVKARDNVGVARVVVAIRNARGALAESGEAEQSAPGGAWWTYTTRKGISMTPFPEVQAIAFDRPGNRDSFTAG